MRLRAGPAPACQLNSSGKLPLRICLTPETLWMRKFSIRNRSIARPAANRSHKCLVTCGNGHAVRTLPTQATWPLPVRLASTTANSCAISTFFEVDRALRRSRTYARRIGIFFRLMRAGNLWEFAWLKTRISETSKTIIILAGRKAAATWQPQFWLEANRYHQRINGLTAARVPYH